MTEIEWEQISPEMHYAISRGTGRVYSATLLDGMWRMSEDDRYLGTRATLDECKSDIEEWDTEPDDQHL